MSDFDITIEPPPAFDVSIDAAPEVSLTLGAQQGHQGIPGPAGGQLNAAAGATLNGHRVLAWDATGRLIHASADNLDHLLAIAGLTEASAVEGDQIPIKASGPIEFSGWSWSRGPVLLGLNGQLVQSIVPGALFVQPIGLGDGTRLFIDIQTPYVLGA
jgi:hypothetical protein